MAAKAKIPTIAQARAIAAILGSNNGRRKVPETKPDGTAAYRDATTRVLVDRRWIVRDGALTEMPSGYFERDYVLSTAGLDALEDFLRAARFKATTRVLPGGGVT